MKLTYRGVEYNYTPRHVQTDGTEVIGQYRGAVCRRARLAAIPVAQPVRNLKYRGCCYSTGVQVQQQPHTVNQPTEIAPASQPEIAVVVNAPESFDKGLTAVASSNNMSIRMREVEKTHQHFIHENLNRRLAVAKQRGDQQLIDQLELEQRQVA